MLKQIEDSKILKGKSLDAKVGCVIYYSALQNNKSRKAMQILAYVNSNKRELNNCFKKCKDQFNFKKLEPSVIVDQVCNKLDFSLPVCKAAKITADNFSTHSMLEGRRP